MNRKTLGLASILVVASMAAAGLIEGWMLPPDARLPIHWGMDGEPDAFAGKWVALMLPSAIIGAVALLFYALPALEPRKDGLARSQGLYLWGWLAMLLMGAVIQVALLSVGFGWGIAVNHLIVGAVGLVLVLIGNQLGKSRSMYLIGLRTPWTLASEEVWIKTHRLCGKLMVIGGLIMVVAALLPLPSGLLASVGIAVVVVSAGVPVAYSFVAWRREAKRDQPSL
jgi:uncharacterized membrane protein